MQSRRAVVGVEGWWERERERVNTVGEKEPHAWWRINKSRGPVSTIYNAQKRAREFIEQSKIIAQIDCDCRRRRAMASGGG